MLHSLVEMYVESVSILLLYTVFAGFHMNSTSVVMKAPANSDNSVVFISAVTVGILLGIFMVFVVAVSLIVICRRRRYLTHFCGLAVSLVNSTKLVQWPCSRTVRGAYHVHKVVKSL